MAKYDYQMRLILENIFEKKDKGPKKNPDNWIAKMTKATFVEGNNTSTRMQIRHGRWS
jgi:small nuclear ribonucleoprotein (snRNP)-like protein